MKYNSQEILSVITKNERIIGCIDETYFDNVATIENADEYSLIWIKPNKNNKEELIRNTKAAVIVCDNSVKVDEQVLLKKCLILCENPKLVFIRIAAHFFYQKYNYGIHPSAQIRDEAVIDPESYIGPNTYIGRSRIGKGTIIHGNCFIYDHVQIGNNVTIHAGTVIGSDGFGYSRNESGELEKFPHFGGVVIEDFVEIGSNTSIDRGSLGNTIIREGAKIDNLVHIAHNVVVGKSSLVIANAMIGGSTTIDDYSWVAPSASLLNQIKIGKNVTVGMGAVVTKNIPDGETWTGVPAKPLKEFLEIQKKIKELTK
jgi:UDP-3-O-[3-hydroxymyristoyl] glucosamine N-acyltransferase